MFSDYLSEIWKKLTVDAQVNGKPKLKASISVESSLWEASSRILATRGANNEQETINW